MKFTATVDQVKQIAANAVTASFPVGMGHLHFTPGECIAEDIKVRPDGIHLDYVEGRMVKLSISMRESGTWQVPDFEPRVDYQSWVAKYPSYKDLVLSVPGVVITDESN